MERTRLRRIEKEMERLRTKLHRSVNGEASRLSDSWILPVSQQLDQLILEYYRELKQIQDK
jgi:hypothetical protein